MMLAKLRENRPSLVRWLLGILLVPALAGLFSGLVWAMDQRIQEQMGSIVDDQMDRREINYLQHQKRVRDLTPQEARDLDYYKEQLRIRQLGQHPHL